MEVKEGLKEANESINERLISRFREINSGDPWYGRNLMSLLGEAVDDRTVIGILNHMISWRKYVIAALQGERPRIDINSSDDWPDHDHLSVKQVKIDFEIANDELIDAIQSFPEDQWFQPLWHGEHHFYKLVTGIIDHDVYHMGQVVILSKRSKIET